MDLLKKAAASRKRAFLARGFFGAVIDMLG